MTSKVSVLVRATGIEDPGRVSDAGRQRPNPEVPERARRRRFTAKYKLAIVAEYDAAPDCEKGELLRREGLYSSHLDYWRRARDAGALAGLARHEDVNGATRGLSGLPAWRRISSNWSWSWPRPASWWMCRQNCTRSWRRSPRGRSPRTGR